MTISALSLKAAMSQGSRIWYYPGLENERGIAVDWIENGSQGDTFPHMVCRISKELALSNQDAACLVRLLDNHKSLGRLERSTGFDLLPFTAIWIWEKANALFQQRQCLGNSVSRTDRRILNGDRRANREHADGVIWKLELDIYAAFAGYYIITGEGLTEKSVEVRVASGWSQERVDTVTRLAIEEAKFWAADAANAIFQRVLHNQ